MGLAYEIVINSNPCIAYLMEENSMCMQALVIAHASYGHNSFFKNNYLFKTWTDADSIIDYLLFARNFIAECEERHGIDEVEKLLLDSCHALMNYGVDRYKRPYPISVAEEKNRQTRTGRAFCSNRSMNCGKPFLQAKRNRRLTSGQIARAFPVRAAGKHALLYREKRTAIGTLATGGGAHRRKVAQYLYPQRQTKVMNEGWACFWHFTITQRAVTEEGLVTDGFMMEFLNHHTNVIYQPPYDSPYYNGLNPYTLGFAMMCDIRRICEEPTEEDQTVVPGDRRQRLAHHPALRHGELQG